MIVLTLEVVHLTTESMIEITIVQIIIQRNRLEMAEMRNFIIKKKERVTIVFRMTHRDTAEHFSTIKVKGKARLRISEPLKIY